MNEMSKAVCCATCNLFFRKWNTNTSFTNILRHYHKAKYNVNIPNITVTEYLLRHMEKWTKYPALIDGVTGKQTSFGELQTEILRSIAGFDSLGLQRGDVACLYATNVPAFVHVLCGVTAVGGTLTIANSQLTPVELSQQLLETKSKYIIASPDCVSRAKSAAALSSDVEEVIVFGEESGCRPFQNLFEHGMKDPLTTLNPCSDIALMPYSSGTTGLPKGVMLTHKNLVSQLSQIRMSQNSGVGLDRFHCTTKFFAHNHSSVLPFEAGYDVSIEALPMVHIAGMMIGMLNPLSQGACAVTLPRFDPEPYLSAIQKYKGTFTLIAPPLVNFFAKHPLVDKYDLSSLHTPYSGAATLSKSLTMQMVERLKIDSIRQGYGLSETTGATHTDPLDGWKFGSIGKPVPNTECKVMCIETNTHLHAEQTGELWCRGPQVTKGYLQNQTATAETITEDGWIRTGDIGYYDKDGHYFIVDRLKDIIKYKGYQISPSYLESILLTHPSVVEAAVVGVACGVMGEVPKACVVTRYKVSSDNLIQYVNERVSPYKRLRGGVVFVNEIPKLPSGKILRRKLKDDIEKSAQTRQTS